MADSVKFIFMTLIKVPVYIMVAFFIFNLFAFTFIYFKMLGISYVVQQTAIENNYIPTAERDTICDYMADNLANISMVENVGLCYKENGYMDVITRKDGATTPSDGAFRKRQYGAKITCGVTCNYVWIWPLDYRTTKSNTNNVAGYANDNTINPYYQSEANKGRTYDQRASKAGNMTEYMRQNTKPTDYSDNNIKIIYELPGLKYYPDLD
jgi:hypothetical protein